MRLQGRITSWNDEKGFGFITWHGDGTKVFVHIKAFPRSSRRPELGNIVTYEVADGKDGKTSAVKVRFTEQSQAKNKVTKKRKSGSFGMFLTLIFAAFIIVAASANRISWAVPALYITVSLLTFLAYWWDKSSARRGRWRTPESTLHLWSLAGGWPGGLAAQRLLRHKSSKQEFLWMFWITVLLNIAAVAYLAWLGEGNPINQLLDLL